MRAVRARRDLSRVQAPELWSLNIRARAGDADRMTRTTILLNQRFALLHAPFGLSKQGFFSPEPPETIPGANERRIEKKRRLEVGDGVLLAALRLVNIAPIVISQRVHGINADGGRVIVDSVGQVSGAAICKSAMIVGACALRIEPNGFAEVGYRSCGVSSDEMRVAPTDME